MAVCISHISACAERALAGGQLGSLGARMPGARFPWYWREDVHQVWEILRRRGFIYFLLVRGVLRWGGFMFIFTVLMTVLGIFHRDLFLSALLRTASICVLGGVAWGAVTWCSNEWLYRKHGSSAP